MLPSDGLPHRNTVAGTKQPGLLLTQEGHIASSFG